MARRKPVFILSRCEKWEGDYIQGVFSSPEKAMETLPNEDWQKDESDNGVMYSTDGTYEWWIIVEYEVDKRDRSR